MNPYAQKELEPPAVPLKRGDSGAKVRQVQEWLCLNDFHTAVDGDFGPATEAAVRAFLRSVESANGEARERGVIDAESWGWLTDPLRRVVEWTRIVGVSPSREIVSCARFHLDAQPREVGKPNGGPFVRLYCRGQEVPWCAGFATTVLGQALGHDDWYTLSCDELATNGMSAGLFLLADERKEIVPGCLFLLRNLKAAPRRQDWIHTGIVTAVHADYFETIEGNTNVDGSREGTAVHARVRAFRPNVDFVRTGGDDR